MIDRTEYFVKKLNDEYANGYDFNTLIIRDYNQIINVKCPDHGFFNTSVVNFIYRAGCPKCRGVHRRGYPYNRFGKDPPCIKMTKRKPGPKPTKMYKFYIHDISGKYLKFGITEGDVEKRRIQIERASEFKHTVVYVKEFHDKQLCKAVEKAVRWSFKRGVVPVGSMGDGSTETIDINHLESLIAIVNSFPVRRV